MIKSKIHIIQEMRSGAKVVRGILGKPSARVLQTHSRTDEPLNRLVLAYPNGKRLPVDYQAIKRMELDGWIERLSESWILTEKS